MADRMRLLGAIVAGVLTWGVMAGVARAEGEQTRGRARDFHLGVGVGFLIPDDNSAFDGSMYFDIRYSFNLGKTLTLDTHLGFVSYDTDDDLPPAVDYDVKSVIPALTVRHHRQVGPVELFSRIGLGFMINDLEPPAEVDNGIVLPIGVGLNYQFIRPTPQLNVGVTVGFEYTHWVTEAEVETGPELDGSIFALTLALDF